MINSSYILFATLSNCTCSRGQGPEREASATVNQLIIWVAELRRLTGCTCVKASKQAREGGRKEREGGGNVRDLWPPNKPPTSLPSAHLAFPGITKAAGKGQAVWADQCSARRRNRARGYKWVSIEQPPSCLSSRVWRLPFCQCLLWSRWTAASFK